MNADPIAEIGYESDTGPRDNPTCAHFKQKRPVEKVIYVGHNKQVLNRIGRGICRIVYAYGWSIGDIAKIFGVSTSSISRAVENTKYLPRDNVLEDYDRVSPELTEMFPPLVHSSPPAIKVISIELFSFHSALILVPSPRIIHINISDDEPDEFPADVAEFRTNGRPSRASNDNCYSLLHQSDAEDVQDSEGLLIPTQAAYKRRHEDAPVVGTQVPAPAPQIYFLAIPASVYVTMCLAPSRRIVLAPPSSHHYILSSNGI
ncbi:hypothetical protein DFH09DRAFT_1161509 [Mycena vulgaris]|nr:hypothetical protein DFH09DRAFT_1161509 [Mycena vulgaris]